MTDHLMDDQTCLFVLSMLMDGRDVAPDTAARARAWAADHPACTVALDELRASAELLASTPTRRASPGFADRVLAAARSDTAAPFGAASAEPVLPFVRRLAVAASVTLVLALGFDLSTPSGLAAEDRLEKQRHVVDHFRSSPFAPDQIVDGLRARLLEDESFGSMGGPSR
jgi:anti-sigma factor RsiW